MATAAGWLLVQRKCGVQGRACRAAWASRPRCAGSILPGPAAVLLSHTCACLPCPCRYDRNTFYTQGEEGYLDYPFLEESEEGKAFLQTVQAD